MRVPNFRPKFPGNVCPGIDAQHNSARRESAAHGTKPCGLPQARDHSATESTRQAPSCHSWPAGCRATGHNRADQRMLKPWAETFLRRRVVTKIFLEGFRNWELYPHSD